MSIPTTLNLLGNSKVIIMNKLIYPIGWMGQSVIYPINYFSDDIDIQVSYQLVTLNWQEGTAGRNDYFY